MSGAETVVENEAFTFEHAMALALTIGRRMSYREVAAHIGRSPQSTLVLMREALLWASRLRDAHTPDPPGEAGRALGGGRGDATNTRGVVSERSVRSLVVS